MYSFILTGANYIFPLLVYPYISRVLGVEKIGVCNFVDSIVNYFVLFSMMGMNILGIREIAQCGNDKLKLSQTFSNLFTLNCITTVVSCFIYIIAIITIPQLHEYRSLLCVGLLKILGNLFLIEWFFKGTENFKYITNRTITVRSLYVIAVFIFVKNKNDLSAYYILTTLVFVVNGIINWLYSSRFISFSIRNIQPFIYSKPFFSLGLYAFLTSLYTSFNVAYLGFVCGPTEVGYYTTATKLYGIIISLFSAITGVLMPRISNLVSQDEHNAVREIIIKSIKVLLLFSLPTVIVTSYFAPQIILLISGQGYEGAITPMRIVMPLVCIIGLAQIFVIQILTPYKQDKAIIINSIIGAFIGVILNIFLVPSMCAAGSSIVWLVSELSVTLLAFYSVVRLHRNFVC